MAPKRSFSVPLKAAVALKPDEVDNAPHEEAQALLKSWRGKVEKGQTRLPFSVVELVGVSTPRGGGASSSSSSACHAAEASGSAAPARAAACAASASAKPAAPDKSVSSAWKDLVLSCALKKAPAAAPASTAKRRKIGDQAEAALHDLAEVLGRCSPANSNSPAAKPAASRGGSSTAGPAAPLSQYASRFDRFRCPLLSAAEAVAITVAFEERGEKLRGVLEKYGCAIVTGVAPPEDCSKLERDFAADLGELLDQGAAEQAGAPAAEAASAAAQDARLWPVQSLALLGPMERCQSRGMPHGRFAWAARLLPRVKSVYATLHGTEDLVSSIDNSFFAPPQHAKQAQNRAFPHVDQNMHDERFRDAGGRGVSTWEVFQGVLYVWGSTEEHASTTVVWPGSHKATYEAIMSDEKVKRAGRKGNHFTQINSLEGRDVASRLMDGWREGCRRLTVPDGALVLWNSRTCHQGWRGGPRLAQPVCWEPRSRRQAPARERKLRMSALGLPSTHWASLGLPHMMLGKAPPKDEATKEATRVKGSWELPVVASLQPRPLEERFAVSDMWKQLQAAPWDKPLPKELAALLERSIRAEFKKVL